MNVCMSSDPLSIFSFFCGILVDLMYRDYRHDLYLINNAIIQARYKLFHPKFQRKRLKLTTANGWSLSYTQRSFTWRNTNFSTLFRRNPGERLRHMQTVLKDIFLIRKPTMTIIYSNSSHISLICSRQQPISFPVVRCPKIIVVAVRSV
jgi:hypothetical protein